MYYTTVKFNIALRNLKLHLETIDLLNKEMSGNWKQN